MLNRELGNRIRETLKTAGYGPRACSVHVSDCGYSTSVHVTIKDPTVNPWAVGEVVSEYNHIRRDARGEILCGCNTYVFTDTSGCLYDNISAAYLDDARMAITKALDENRKDCCVYRAGNLLLTSDIIGAELLIMAYTDTEDGLQGRGRVWVSRTPSAESIAEIIYKLNTFGQISAI